MSKLLVEILVAAVMHLMKKVTLCLTAYFQTTMVILSNSRALGSQRIRMQSTSAKNYCFADDVCETASAVGDSCPVACGFADGSNEYRGCPEEVEVEALPEPVLPPVAAFPAPSPSSKGMSKGMSKGSSGSVPSAPSKGYPTDTQNASSPTVGSGKGTSKGSTYAPGSSSTTSSKGMSKGSTYAPGSSSTTSGKGMSKGTSKGSTYAPGSSSTTSSKGLSKGSTYSPASKGNSKGYTRGLRKMLQKS